MWTRARAHAPIQNHLFITVQCAISIGFTVEDVESSSFAFFFLPQFIALVLNKHVVSFYFCCNMGIRFCFSSTSHPLLFGHNPNHLLDWMRLQCIKKRMHSIIHSIISYQVNSHHRTICGIWWECGIASSMRDWDACEHDNNNKLIIYKWQYFMVLIIYRCATKRIYPN